jgi:1,4-alpha-glucan branching enzyme
MMSLEKRSLKSRPVTKVTFSLPRAAVPDAAKVHLVGDFNDWRTDATPMTRLKNGEFKVCLDLETGREYQFRYLVGDDTWENDWEADRYAPTGITSEENSVVKA